MDSKIRTFQITLEDYIAGYDIPAEVKRLVLKSILLDVEAQANIAIKSQLEEVENNGTN